MSEAVDRFNAAFNAEGIAGIGACVTDDFTFEDTSPPGGKRYDRAAALAFFASLFHEPRTFEAEETIEAGDRVVVTWVHRWDGGEVRGVDLFRVRDGLVAEKRSYVKG